LECCASDNNYYEVDAKFDFEMVFFILRF
jgi:hypothetical protein